MLVVIVVAALVGFGGRPGKIGQCKDSSPVILSIDTGTAASDGGSFYRSDSGVWLSGPIPATAVEVLGVTG